MTYTPEQFAKDLLEEFGHDYTHFLKFAAARKSKHDDIIAMCETFRIHAERMDSGEWKTVEIRKGKPTFFNPTERELIEHLGLLTFRKVMRAEKKKRKVTSAEKYHSRTTSREDSDIMRRASRLGRLFADPRHK